MNMTTEHLATLIENAFSLCIRTKLVNALDHNSMLDIARLQRILRRGVMPSQVNVCYEIMNQVQMLDRNLMPEAYEREEEREKDEPVEKWAFSLTKSVSVEDRIIDLETRHGLADPENDLYARRVAQSLKEITAKAVCM